MGASAVFASLVALIAAIADAGSVLASHGLPHRRFPFFLVVLLGFLIWRAYTRRKSS